MASKDTTLLVGYFVSETLNNHSVCEDLAVLLENQGWGVLRTSSATTRVQRLADMLRTVWTHRNSYSTACVDVYSGKAFVWAEAVCALLRLLNKPYILTLRGGSLPIFAAKNPKRVARLLTSARCVTAPSGYLVERMRQYHQAVSLVPNPLAMEHYNFRRRSALSPRLVWMRAFHNVYNPELAIRTLHHVLMKRPDARLLMFGPDKGDGSLQRTRDLAAQLGVTDRVEFRGGVPKPQVPDRLQEGDIYLNTPNIDNTPITVLEALALGLCVVSTEVGGIPYLVRHGRDALLVPTNDSQAMAQAVFDLLDNPALAQTLSINGRELTAARDWSRVLPIWIEMLERYSRGRIESLSRLAASL